MAPKKRKTAAPGADTQSIVNPDHIAVLNKRMDEIDTAVEERCEAIKAAADEAVAKLMQQLKMQLLLLPKKVRTMPYKDYVAQLQDSQSDPSAAAAARLDSVLEAAQQQSVAAATAAPTTRSLRSRARSVTAAEPRTTRSTRSRQAVPAAVTEPEPAAATQATSTAEPEASPEAAAAAVAPGQPQLPTLHEADSPARSPAAAPAAAAAAAPAAMSRAAAAGQPAAAAAGQPAAAAAAEAMRAAARAKVDAKLAALSLGAGTAARGADRTVMRKAQPGEACFSKNGSPLSIHPNVTRHRGRAIAASLMTPALQAAAPAGSSMVGCITLIKKQPAAGGAAAAAAATGRSKRSRAAVAAGVAEEQPAAGAGAEGTAMMVTTDDGSAFTVDTASGGLQAVPARYRDEVAAKLKAIQQMAAAALGCV